MYPFLILMSLYNTIPYDLVELLLGSGDIDVNCRGDLADWTALHTAASNGHTASVDMLIENNATTDATDMVNQVSCVLCCVVM